jgi:Na+/H+-translocating membrane pyrophosphatase
MLVFVFSGLTIRAVGDAAGAVVREVCGDTESWENGNVVLTFRALVCYCCCCRCCCFRQVRRQLAERPGIINVTTTSSYRCVNNSNTY